MNHTLLLASTSPYRAELLSRLRLPFHSQGSEVDEALRVEEPARDRAVRLAHAKAAALQRQHQHAWVIGSDQVAALEGEILRKPGNVARQREQLRRMSGRQVTFHTAVCLLSPVVATVEPRIDCIDTRVRFRTLDEGEIDRYVDAEAAADCAGGFKVEGLGISLFESVESTDPTALVGLPMIRLAERLRSAGFHLP